MRRRIPPDWELRDQRFEEIYSDDDEEEQARGVLLDPRARRPRVSDDLYFGRYDVARDRISRGGAYDPYGDDFDLRELEYGDEEGYAHQAAIREKEDALIHRALERIARARAKGRNNVNLSEEEMEALERRRNPQPEPSRPALASPPPTPARTKSKATSRSNSASNLASKARKRSSGLFGGSSSPAKSSSKAKTSASRRGSMSPPNGMQLQGPVGAPMYAPLGYYGPHNPEYAAPRQSSKSISRSGSKQRRRQSTPPDRPEMYASYPPPHYYYSAPRVRPESAGSNRSLPDDVDWSPPGPRHRSTSNVQYTGYHTDYDALPAAQSRRNISGPPDVRYSQLRRVPTTSTALAARPPNKHSSQSDPAVTGRKASGLSQQIGESSSSSSSSDDDEDDDDRDEGVHVELLPDAGNGLGYSVGRAALPAPPTSGNEGRKRRSGRK